MKKLKLRYLMDLPKVSKVIRPGIVIQIHIFKLQNPNTCPGLRAYPPITAVGTSLQDESRYTVHPRPSKKDRFI